MEIKCSKCDSTKVYNIDQRMHRFMTPEDAQVYEAPVAYFVCKNCDNRWTKHDEHGVADLGEMPDDS